MEGVLLGSGTLANSVRRLRKGGQLSWWEPPSGWAFLRGNSLKARRLGSWGGLPWSGSVDQMGGRRSTTFENWGRQGMVMW